MGNDGNKFINGIARFSNRIKIIMTKYNFKGWKLLEFLKGRKKLVVALVGAVAGYLATQDPAIAGIAAIGADFIFAILDYYIQK